MTKPPPNALRWLVGLGLLAVLAGGCYWYGPGRGGRIGGGVILDGGGRGDGGDRHGDGFRHDDGGRRGGDDR